MRAFVMGLICASGCLEPSVRECPDGRVCGANLSCDSTHGLCVAPEALTACNGIEQGKDCSFADRMGTCDRGVCLETFCGDGVRTGTEQCDGDDLGTDKDGGSVTCLDRNYYEDGPITCDKQCRYDESQCHRFCGDGVKDAEEQCDMAVDAAHDDCKDFGYYRAGTVGCTASCVFDVATACVGKGSCGDGVTDPEESCEPGVTVPIEGCLDFAYDAGRVGCSNACTADLSNCKKIGWKQIDNSAPGTLFDVLVSGSSILVTSEVGLAQIVNRAVQLVQPNLVYGYGLWGTPNDAYTAGSFGLVTHYDGATETILNPAGTDGTKHLMAIWASSSSNIYAVGYDRIWHNPPSSASGDTFTTTGWDYYDVWGTSDGSSVFALRNVRDVAPADPVIDKIATVSPLTVTSMVSSPSIGTGTVLYSMYGVNGSSVYAVGSHNAIVHYDGNSVTTLTQDQASSKSLTAIWGRSDNDLYAVGSTGVGWINNGTWWPVDPGVSVLLFGISGDATDVVAVGDSRSAFRYQGASWIRHAAPSLEANATQVYASDPDEVFVLATSELDHKVSVGFTSLGAVGGICMWRKGAAFAVGLSGAIRYTTGAGWTIETFAGSNSVRALGGASLTDLYAGLSNGQVWHRSASGWAQETIPAPVLPEVAGLWVAPTGEVFVVGGAQIRRRDAAGSWHADNPDAPTNGNANSLSAIWGTSKDNVWAVGAFGWITHFDGTSWTRVTPPSSGSMLAIGGTAADDVWVGGYGGVLFRYDGVAWNPVRLPAGLQAGNIISLSARGDLVMFLSVNGATKELAGIVRTSSW